MPSQRSSRVCCIGETSWYSSTTKWWYCARTASATPGRPASKPTAASRMSSRSNRPRSVLTSSYAAYTRPTVSGSTPATSRRAASAALGIGVRGHVGHLGPFEFGGEVSQRRPVSAHPAPARGCADQGQLARGDLGELPVHHLRPEVAGLPQCRRVERPRLDAVDPQRTKPRPHLPRGSGGERDS